MQDYINMVQRTNINLLPLMYQVKKIL